MNFIVQLSCKCLDWYNNRFKTKIIKENKMTREEIAKAEPDKAYERLLKNTGLTKRIGKAKDAKKE